MTETLTRNPSHLAQIEAALYGIAATVEPLAPVQRWSLSPNCDPETARAKEEAFRALERLSDCLVDERTNYFARRPSP